MLFTILFAGCAGVKPYELRNNREGGPGKGFFQVLRANQEGIE